jgi:hypothetical protein
MNHPNKKGIYAITILHHGCHLIFKKVTNELQTAIIILVTNESVLLHLLFNLSQQFRENQSHPCAHPIYMISEGLQDMKKAIPKTKSVLLPWHTFLPTSLVWL